MRHSALMSSHIKGQLISDAYMENIKSTMKCQINKINRSVMQSNRHKNVLHNIGGLFYAIHVTQTRRRTGDKPLPEPMLTHFTDVYMRH